MSQDIAQDINDNLRIGIEELTEYVSGGQTREFGSIIAASSGLPIPILNRVFVFETPAAEKLKAAVRWMNDLEVPYWVTAVETIVGTVEDMAADLGLVKANTQPGMAMKSLDTVPQAMSPATITEINTAEELDDFSRVSSAVFEMPEDVAKQVDRTALEVDTVHSFLGRVDGKPAACGTLIRTGEVAGVYTIGVREPFRRQGIGKAMSCEVIRTGRDLGCDAAVLQSSEMAYPLYEQLGFETAVTYHHFEPET